MDDRVEGLCEIIRETKGDIPPLFFGNIKDLILGKNYRLSLVFASKATSSELHKKYQGKSDPANVLSFPLTTNSGEIFINLEKTRLEAKNFSHSYYDHLRFLFIHGCLHLKGLDHGDEMDQLEEKFMKKTANTN